ncbi:MAG: phage tail protein [Flavobacteriaceae bacterium]|nr:MAG: phage tail protein [Flavobacteriaceae bacterium]
MDSFLAEIRIFAGNFAPRFWEFCNGQLWSISQNEALFSILGTIYGGDGRTTFALPDLRSRVPVCTGTGTGLNNVPLGSSYGSESVVLTVDHLPSHTHSVSATVAPLCNSGSPEDSDNPQGNFLSSTSPNDYFANSANAQMGESPVSVTIEPAEGKYFPIDIRQPSLGLNYIICTSGIYPSRT